MKTLCKQCGCHFATDFKETLRMPCNYWGDHGMANLPYEDKKLFWAWLFTAPFDEFLVKYSLGFKFDYEAYHVLETVKFENIVDNWSALNPKDKHKFQKEYFLKYGNEIPSLKIHYDPTKGL